MKKYIVKEAFKDSQKYVAEGSEARLYEPGQDVSSFDAARLKDLVSRKLVLVEDDGKDEQKATTPAKAKADSKDKK